MKAVISATALAGCALVAVAVAGCGTTPVPLGGTGSASAGPSPGSPAPVTSSGPTPRQRAVADAASILASFVPPPGAVRLPGPPVASGGAGGMLKRQPVVPLRLADLVDDVTWWRVPGQPQAVLSWEKAHLPGRFARSGSGTVGVPPVTWSDEFTLPPVTGVLDWRELAVEAAAAGGGRTDLRVDAEVTWLPAKPAAERVPPEATAVTISAVPGFMVGAKVPAPVTITDPAKVSRIASLVNGLSLIRPGGFNCPMDRGRAVRLTFRASAEGPALAIVSAGLTGCEGVTFTAGGTRQPMLAGGAALARQVLTIAGLSWTGYGTGSPVPGGVMMPG